jgi:hypothetical protein
MTRDHAADLLEGFLAWLAQLGEEGNLHLLDDSGQLEDEYKKIRLAWPIVVKAARKPSGGRGSDA